MPHLDIYRLAVRIAEGGRSAITRGLGGLPALRIGVEDFGIIACGVIQRVVAWPVVIDAGCKCLIRGQVGVETGD
ncbi:hypothetical protein BLL36_06470 [Pseudomonas cedrina subsp. cedrina]|uniref:Uncharacterized protein n=1 Tax=Pseudomonas cedrina subsp. cedrina TaxID=76762 RepID=A0A1V2KE15_PSECE|nr:hypothetical protein BLL36_06470 [Pseudomonas cedrina subsp. cedrina]